MEVMADEVDGSEFGVGDVDASIGVWVELAANLEAGFGSGFGDQFDDDLTVFRFLSPRDAPLFKTQ